MKKLLAVLLSLSASFAYAGKPNPEAPESFVSILKLPSGRFMFQVCQLTVCDPLGSEEGYTYEQINGMHGHLKAYLGTLEGAAGAAIGVFLSACASQIDAGVAPATGAAIPAVGASLGQDIGVVVGPVVTGAI